MRLKYMICRKARERGHESAHEQDKYSRSAERIMQSESYEKYVEKHGYHFTDALSEHVSKGMKNANGTPHSWTVAQVINAMKGLSLSVPQGVTDGDIAYLANMYYADFYPDVLKDDVSCLKAAHAAANDIDGYEGMAFCRWVADAIGKNISIDWDKFI